MGFIPDIERICKLVPFTRQTLFFTATMPPEIQRVTAQFLHNPVKIEVARPSSTAATITQSLVRTGRKDFEKRETLRSLIRSAENLKNAIIFCNRKSEVATVYKSLQKHEFSVAALHGDMDQRARMAALASFRDGTIKLLVASDVAARGLDIPEVSHVFNYDTPHHAEDYVHRIGRTGRAGRLGTAITLVTGEDGKQISAIEKLIGQPIAWATPPITEEDAQEARAERRADREAGHGGDKRRTVSRGGRDAGRDRNRDRHRRDESATPRAAITPATPQPAPQQPVAAKVAEAPVAAKPRPAKAPVSAPAHEPADMSHLPSFLLRSVATRGR